MIKTNIIKDGQRRTEKGEGTYLTEAQRGASLEIMQT